MGIPKSAELTAIEIILQRVMPSKRQSGESVIRAIYIPFGRLQTVLKTDGNQRKIIIELAVHLLNFRTRKMGRHQIAPTHNQAPSDLWTPAQARRILYHSAILL